MTKKVGRNELCPCGSGKKYKNCCLRRNNFLDFTRLMLKREMEPLREDLAKYIFSMPAQLEKAYKAFKARTCADWETMLLEMQNFLPDAFMEWFLFDFTLPSGTTPFRQFIKKQQKEYRSISLQQLQEWEKVPFSIYQIKDINDKDEYVLEDIFTMTNLILYLPETEEVVEEDDYLFLRALPAGNSHVYLFSVFTLPLTMVESIHTALKADKNDTTSWQKYLKKKGDFLLKLILDEEHSMQQEITNDEIMGIDIDGASAILQNLSFFREQFKVKFEELKGLNLLQAYWEPDIQNEFLDIINNIDNNNVISEAFQLDEKLLDISNWDNIFYYHEAQLLLEKMKGYYFPLEIEIALATWQEFSSNLKPLFRKKGVWAAAVEYALSYLSCTSVYQKDIAAKYNVSVNSISKNYYKFLSYWNYFRDTEDDEPYFPPTIGYNRKIVEREIAALHAYLEQVKPKDEKELQQIIAEINKKGLPKVTTASPEFQSQELIYDAWETGDPREKIKLAKKALQIYPYNADAYLILAEESAMSLPLQKAFLLKGLEAGEKSLGSDFFQKNTGNFWSIIESRPYMRVKSALAQCLWELGEKENALQHLRELLELNPNDNQGIRYLLLSYLLATNRLEECKKLLEKYDEDYSANWLYNKALVEYKRKDKALADLYLQKALEFNPHVVDYLLGTKCLPFIPPQYYSPGAEDEAQIYAIGHKELWSQTKGALRWLQATFASLIK